MAATTVSPFAILSQPLAEISDYLNQYGAKLAPTKYSQTYIIKFNPLTKAYHPAVNQLRGLIFRVSEDANFEEIYSLGFPVPIEFKDQTKEVQQTIVDQLHQTTYLVQEAMDGTLIRLWFHPESQEWKISTNSKEDAYDAYWMNGLSFGTMFESTLAGIFKDLNPNHIYLFALCHPLNVIVVNHIQPKIYHLTTIDRITLLEVDIELGLPHPSTFEMTVDEVLDKIQNSQGNPVASAGYTIVPVPDESGIVKRYRFENVNYTRARALRGDSNNIEEIILRHLFRLTESLDIEPAPGLPSKLLEFLQCYPVYQLTYNRIVEKLNRLVVYIFNVYTQRYKYRKEVTVDARHHRFILNLHKELYVNHLRLQKRPVTQQDVTNYIYNQSPTTVSHLIEIM